MAFQARPSVPLKEKTHYYISPYWTSRTAGNSRTRISPEITLKTIKNFFLIILFEKHSIDKTAFYRFAAV